MNTYTTMTVTATEFGNTVWAVRDKAIQTARWLRAEVDRPNEDGWEVFTDITIHPVSENWDGWPTRWKAEVRLTAGHTSKVT